MIQHFTNKLHIPASRGYTLLFSVLTATLVLGVAVFILGVAKKQLALSVAARDSTFAIYAADTAMECTISTINSSGISSSTGGTIRCDNNTASASMTVFEVYDTSDDLSYSYPNSLKKDNQLKQGSAVVRFPDSSCARVIVTMGTLAENDEKVTLIDSRGYNICDGDGPDPTNARTVERAFRLTERGVWY